MKFAQLHVLQVMNFDFDRPQQKLVEMAKTSNIDLKDKRILEEFKIIQQQNLEDIRRLKQGLP